MTAKTDESIDQRFVKALAHPVRIAILDSMRESATSPNQLAELLHLALSGVAYHMRILEKCGAIELSYIRPVRGATEHFYRARPDAFIGSKHWRRVPENLRAGSAGFSLDALNARAIAAMESGAFAAREGSALTWNVITVDAKGWRELAAVMHAVPDQIARIHERSVRRLGDEPGASAVAGVIAFESAPWEDND